MLLFVVLVVIQYKLMFPWNSSMQWIVATTICKAMSLQKWTARLHNVVTRTSLSSKEVNYVYTSVTISILEATLIGSHVSTSVWNGNTQQGTGQYRDQPKPNHHFTASAALAWGSSTSQSTLPHQSQQAQLHWQNPLLYLSSIIKTLGICVPPKELVYSAQTQTINEEFLICQAGTESWETVSPSGFCGYCISKVQFQSLMS